MEIIKKHLTNGQYLTSEYVKDAIFLHHTAGLSAESAWQWWNQTPDRVGTPFIIDRNGKVVECFDPKVWAFHLGLVGDDNYHEMHSVNIELVSGGQLYKDNGIFKFYPIYPNKQFYTEIPEEEVYTLDVPWKGFTYFHKYTDAQISVLKELITYIMGLFPTIKIQEDLTDFYQFNPDIVAKHRGGLWAHSTVRENSIDIFPQSNLLEALKELAGKESIPTTTKKPKTPKA